MSQSVIIGIIIIIVTIVATIIAFPKIQRKIDEREAKKSA